MDNEIEELLILEEKVKSIKKRIRERKKSKTITIDGETHEMIKNHCASINVNIGEWVSKKLLEAVESHKEEFNCLITDEIDQDEFEESEKKRILEKYTKKAYKHLFKSNKLLLGEDLKFVGQSLFDNLPIYEFTGNDIQSFTARLFEQVEDHEGLSIVEAFDAVITKGFMIEDMDFVILQNKKLDTYKTGELYDGVHFTDPIVSDSEFTTLANEYYDSYKMCEFTTLVNQNYKASK